MHVEDVHEDADLQRITVEPGIASIAHEQHAPIGGTQDEALAGRDLARRVAEELQDEECDDPERSRPPAEEIGRERRDRHREREKGPAFPRDDRMRVVGHWIPACAGMMALVVGVGAISSGWYRRACSS